MSISDREQQVLESIESDLASTGPKLASMLAIFARLTAGEDMPVRERLRRAFPAPSARTLRAGAPAPARPTWRHRTAAALRRHLAWLICLVVVIALVVLTVTSSRMAGPGACPAAAACQRVSGPGGTLHGGH